MVSYKEIRASNALINDATGPRVAVFVGGTSGIGSFTVKELVATGASVKIYLVGRKSSEERTRAFIEELRAINSKAELIWTEGEISLLAETQRICKLIKDKERHVDLLFLSAGYAPMSGRVETAEGVEITQSLEYYGRVLCILHLLPLLSQAEAPKVVSVLGAGMEPATINLDDLDLKKPGSLTFMTAQLQWAAMNTMMMERLATDNPGVTFVHSCPGWVSTGNLDRGLDWNSIWAWAFYLILTPLIYLFGFDFENTGQRYLFQSTSAYYGGRGVPWKGKTGVNSLEKAEDGLFLVDSKCNCTSNAKALSVLREKSQQKIWDHTQEMLQPYL